MASDDEVLTWGGAMGTEKVAVGSPGLASRRRPAGWPHPQLASRGPLHPRHRRPARRGALGAFGRPSWAPGGRESWCCVRRLPAVVPQCSTYYCSAPSSFHLKAGLRTESISSFSTKSQLTRSWDGCDASVRL